MTAVAEEIAGALDEMPQLPHAVGPIGRLGRYAATHFRRVLFAWLVVAVGLAVDVTVGVSVESMRHLPLNAWAVRPGTGRYRPAPIV